MHVVVIFQTYTENILNYPRNMSEDFYNVQKTTHRPTYAEKMAHGKLGEF